MLIATAMSEGLLATGPGTVLVNGGPSAGTPVPADEHHVLPATCSRNLARARVVVGRSVSPPASPSPYGLVGLPSGCR